MSSVLEFEPAAARLPRDEFAKFERWFVAGGNRSPDQQQKTGSAEGLLDFLEEGNAAASH